MPRQNSGVASVDSTRVAHHYLVAMPSLTDPQFGGTVIYVAEHSAKGAMGLVLNRPSEMLLGQLLDRIDISSGGDDDIQVDATPLEIGLSGDMPVFIGGPVQSDRGFVLHEPLGRWNSTLALNDLTGLTSSRDILEAFANGRGPARLFVALGYAGWGEGQLDQELAANAWLTVPATDTSLIFDVRPEDRHACAFRMLGVDPIHFMGAAGHA